MFAELRPQPDDPILALMDRFRADPRADKIDLGVGVYRNSRGVTPVMQAVKSAEQQLLERQESKSYTGLAGDPAFVAAMTRLVLGGEIDAERIAGAATVGGTGALRQALDLARLASPGATVHIPDPSWPNHRAIIEAVGLSCRSYRYYDPAAGGIDIEGMIADLAAAEPGDVVVLHGCCHNPTGADPTAAQWHDIVEALRTSRATVLIDLAYLGFGEGLDADAAATRLVARQLPEVIVAVSCSKNFGLYRDRAGVVLVLSETGAHRDVVQGNLATLNRLAYSFPADHGAKVAETILNDPALHASWTEELGQMRGRINELRRSLADALRSETGSDRFAFLASQNGMFSRLAVPPEDIRRLREEKAIYLIGDGRLNVAGLNAEDIPRLARAIAEISP
ncbi:aspartate aminotransferase [Pseudooceanicola batsensis HTCC2597]|uniref:Aminotransferase n=1 Tax=Pseudooceanicola batsensis (strain ATCC BAA-863 / DSM 15984 / KCTC 12145 / HTCC2597) TaxID=252305 RepID=A3TW35_PSEBH|nr:amino acid aminotransferase [Pseudooceanicola batsensis]EAQ03831.1 aspartate aminotransferase [Pseudooceanicola batsensis HTCC2597]